jgi:hypothetical protein
MSSARQAGEKMSKETQTEKELKAMKKKINNPGPKCPISGIYCADCGVLQSENRYCPIVKFADALESISENLKPAVT